MNDVKPITRQEMFDYRMKCHRENIEALQQRIFDMNDELEREYGKLAGCVSEMEVLKI